VPTWNYTAVHVYGRCRVIREAHELGAVLADTVRFYEPNSPLLGHLNEEFYSNMARGIVGFEIEISRMEGKAKLSQNRSAGSVQGVIGGLRQSPDYQAAEVARLMESNRIKGGLS
jgi:transcriptional regulator